ncbi:uncharacterized protein LOC128553878 [Mercenaria mercenaria]|uniref:uncharacterized protein LOC128553878 n=1 Tax=Mercenaria mercenaria TaxID=6596 RepID=UPI00234E4E0E|nr:uncharacterized protein LOC128553878 [Mercenaria mercenaria]
MASGMQSSSVTCGPGASVVYQSPNGHYQTNNSTFSTPQASLNFVSPQSFSYMQALNNGSPNMQNMQSIQPMQPWPISSGNMNGVFTDQFSSMIQKLDSIDKKLSQLDSIKNTVDKITGRLDTVDQKVNSMETKINDLERSREYDSSSMADIEKKQKEIDSLLSKLKVLEHQQTEQERSMKADITDLKCRNMRDNLLFFGIPEVKGESDSDCVEKVLDLIKNKLEIKNAKSSIKLHRAHRIGKFDNAKTRPIVAKFVYYPEREKVRLSANKLERPYGISLQFPQEVMSSRRRLIPIMLEARKQGKEAYIKVDKLYIDGRLHRESESGSMK